MNKTKKALALLLAVILCMTLVPTAALATPTADTLTAIDLTKLKASDTQQEFTFTSQNVEIRFTADTLESMKKIAVNLWFGPKSGGAILELTGADGKTVGWYDYANYVIISLKSTPPQDISTHQVVLVNGDGTVVPRSWYSDGRVYAKINAPGTYASAIKSLGNFTDTKSLWMNEAVGYMAARDIVRGVGGGLFDAGGTITRAHFVTMLMRTLNLELDYEEAMPPEDYESAPDWAQEDIRKATALGLTLRDEDGNFNPNAPILRQEMFFMAHELMQVCGMLPDMFTMEWIIFSDWDGNVKGEYSSAIQNLCKLGLVKGPGDGTLNPNGESTRSEGAQFIYNILKYDTK